MQLLYWKEQLYGLPALELPTDRPLPPVQTFRGASLWFDLPSELSGDLRHLAERDGWPVCRLNQHPRGDCLGIGP